MLETLASWASAATALLGIVIPFPARSKAAPAAAIPATRTVAATKPLPASARSRRATSEMAIQIPGKALTPAQHFARVSQVVAHAICSANLATEIQEQARIQLEVVEISIDRILEEVAEVMALTPEMQRRFKPALVPVAGRHRAA